jgi:hypothetical protein
LIYDTNNREIEQILYEYEFKFGELQQILLSKWITEYEEY